MLARLEKSQPLRVSQHTATQPTVKVHPMPESAATNTSAETAPVLQTTETPTAQPADSTATARVGMGRPSKFTEQQLADALAHGGGSLSEACRFLQHRWGRAYNPRSLSDSIKKSPRLAAVRAEAEEIMLDFAEAALLRLMEAGNVQAIHFYLRTKGGSRGYGVPVNCTCQKPTTIPEEKVTGFRGLTNEEAERIQEILERARARAHNEAQV
jgi:hypothetical protein